MGRNQEKDVAQDTHGGVDGERDRIARSYLAGDC
jgi:hypothetical protein